MKPYETGNHVVLFSWMNSPETGELIVCNLNLLFLSVDKVIIFLASNTASKEDSVQ